MAEEKISKAEAVRRVIAEEPDLSPAEAVALIKSKYGIDMTPSHFSTTKSQEMKRKQAAGPSTPTRARTRVESQVEKPAAAPAVGADPLEAAQAVKALVERYGAKTVKGLADLFGGEE